jgi:hypothetical protein
MQVKHVCTGALKKESKKTATTILPTVGHRTGIGHPQLPVLS